jgi:hypothetical protein
MAGEMDVDVPEQRGEKRPVEETDVSGPPKPKRIKVGLLIARLPTIHAIILKLTEL